MTTSGLLLPVSNVKQRWWSLPPLTNLTSLCSLENRIIELYLLYFNFWSKSSHSRLSDSSSCILHHHDVISIWLIPSNNIIRSNQLDINLKPSWSLFYFNWTLKFHASLSNTIHYTRARSGIQDFHPNQMLYSTSYRQVEYSIWSGCKSCTPRQVLVLWFYPILCLAVSNQSSQSATLLQISIVVHHTMDIHSMVYNKIHHAPEPITLRGIKKNQTYSAYILWDWLFWHFLH